MAKLVSTARPLKFEGGTAGVRQTPSLAAISCSANTSIALGALHTFLDPLIRVHADRRVHAFGRIAHNFDDLRFPALLVEAIGTVRRLGDALVAITERHLHVAGRTFEFD